MQIRTQLSSLERSIVSGLSGRGSTPFVSLGRIRPGDASSDLVSLTSGESGPSSVASMERRSLQSRLALIGQRLDSVSSVSSVLDDVRTTLGSIREQVATIREKALADVDGLLSSADRAANQTAIDGAINQINELASSRFGGKQLLAASTRLLEKVAVAGSNDEQLSRISVDSVTLGSSSTIAGRLVSAAEAAELTYASEGGAIGATASLTITGDQGSTAISVTKGESLASVRDRINAQSDDTGVVSVIRDNELVFQSVDTGAAASASVHVDSVEDELEISGVNGAQVVDFQTSGLGADFDETISGTVLTREAQAELTYTGSGGLVVAAAKIKVQGNVGNKTLTISAGESLTSVRDRVNAVVGITGVTASLEGETLTFNSTEVGTAARATVQRTQGTFVVNGGDGNGTDYGENDTATIDGQTVTGSDGVFTHTTANGTYQLTLADGFTGAFDPIRVRKQTGRFDVDGGDGNGSANGVDGVAEVNGQTLTSGTNSFTFNDDDVALTLEFATSFSGEFDTFTATSTPVVERSKRSLGIVLADEDGRRLKPLKIAGLSASALGDGVSDLHQLLSGGTMAGLGVNSDRAVEIADAALRFLDAQEAEIDRYQSTILEVTGDSLTEAKSDIERLLDDLTPTSSSSSESSGASTSPARDATATLRRDVIARLAAGAFGFLRSGSSVDSRSLLLSLWQR